MLKKDDSCKNVMECCVSIWCIFGPWFVGRRVANCEHQREWLMGVWTPRHTLLPVEKYVQIGKSEGKRKNGLDTQTHSVAIASSVKVCEGKSVYKSTPRKDIALQSNCASVKVCRGVQV